jgi:hypothetical protein
MVEAWACAVFNTGRTLVSTNLATFTVSLAATARACSTLVINALIVFSFSPLTAGDADNQFLLYYFKRILLEELSLIATRPRFPSITNCDSTISSWRTSMARWASSEIWLALAFSGQKQLSTRITGNWTQYIHRSPTGRTATKETS